MESEYLKRPDAKGHLKVLDALRRWDPIGVYGPGSTWPDDEYDMYAPAIIRMLDAGITARDLAQHLKSIAIDMMGLSGDDKMNFAIAQELVSFWKEWKDGQQSVAD